MMFGIGKGKSPLNAPIALEDARFSSEDLFALMGGYDNLILIAGDAFRGYGDEQLAQAMDKWRKKALTRLLGTGLLDKDGLPGDELKAALEPLSAPGLDVSTNAEQLSSKTAGLFMYQDNWTLVKRAPGYFGGWTLRRLDPADGLDAAVSELLGVPAPVYSEWNTVGYILDRERDELIEAATEGNKEVLNRLASNRLLPKGALFDLSDSVGDSILKKSPRQYELHARDFSGCKMMVAEGIKVPVTSEGVWSTGAISVVPEKGFYMNMGTAPKPGDTFEMYSDAPACRARTYCRVGFVGSGSFYEQALKMPRVFTDDLMVAYNL